MSKNIRCFHCHSNHNSALCWIRKTIRVHSNYCNSERVFNKERPLAKMKRNKQSGRILTVVSTIRFANNIHPFRVYQSMYYRWMMEPRFWVPLMVNAIGYLLSQDGIIGSLYWISVNGFRRLHTRGNLGYYCFTMNFALWCYHYPFCSCEESLAINAVLGVSMNYRSWNLARVARVRQRVVEETRLQYAGFPLWSCYNWFFLLTGFWVVHLGWGGLGFLQLSISESGFFGVIVWFLLFSCIVIHIAFVVGLITQVWGGKKEPRGSIGFRKFFPVENWKQKSPRRHPCPACIRQFTAAGIFDWVTR